MDAGHTAQLDTISLWALNGDCSNSKLETSGMCTWQRNGDVAHDVVGKRPSQALQVRLAHRADDLLKALACQEPKHRISFHEQTGARLDVEDSTFNGETRTSCR